MKNIKSYNKFNEELDHHTMHLFMKLAALGGMLAMVYGVGMLGSKKVKTKIEDEAKKDSQFKEIMVKLSNDSLIQNFISEFNDNKIGDLDEFKASVEERLRDLLSDDEHHHIDDVMNHILSKS